MGCSTNKVIAKKKKREREREREREMIRTQNNIRLGEVLSLTTFVAWFARKECKPGLQPSCTLNNWTYYLTNCSWTCTSVSRMCQVWPQKNPLTSLGLNFFFMKKFFYEKNRGISNKMIFLVSASPGWWGSISLNSKLLLALKILLRTKWE